MTMIRRTCGIGDIHELQGFKDEYDRLGEKMLEIFKVCSGIFGE